MSSPSYKLVELNVELPISDGLDKPDKHGNIREPLVNLTNSHIPFALQALSELITAANMEYRYPQEDILEVV